jgi:hypothetical protein
MVPTRRISKVPHDVVASRRVTKRKRSWVRAAAGVPGTAATPVVGGTGMKAAMYRVGYVSACPGALPLLALAGGADAQ